MTTQLKQIDELYQYTATDPNLQDPDTAHLAIDGNKVLGKRAVPGLDMDIKETADGIEAVVRVQPEIKIEKPVHLCFGMLPEEGLQKIVMDVEVGAGARISLLAHCVFPRAIDVQHLMDARIRLHENARYSYRERHVHSPRGGIRVVPKALIEVGPGAVFETDFELIRGRVGVIDIDYRITAAAKSLSEMTARVSGRADDRIKINEQISLDGEGARGVLTSKVAVRDDAEAEIRNTIIANAPHARGHVDCKEVLRDRGKAAAIPIVRVNHPLAHVTHEAAIGSVDGKQLQTLMARGLSEDDAVETIVNGLLSA